MKREYNLELTNVLPVKKFDAIVLAVAHKEFLQLNIKNMIKENGIIYDVKGLLNSDIVDGRL